MCGFGGFFLPQGFGSLPVVRCLDEMGQVLRPRGPDAVGSWHDDKGTAFIFRRLAIQDTSEAGHQPMVSRSGRLTIVFNGEIYNHMELRRILPGSRRWRGRSDTETLLALLETQGVADTLPLLNGMFAFAVWDSLSKSITLVRDRLGIKPLYLAKWRGGLAFASELKALQTLPGFARDLDYSVLAEYVSRLYVPEPDTPWTGVAKLPAGNLVTVSDDDQTFTPTRWWTESPHPPKKQIGPRPAENYEAALTDLLEDSVRARLLADVPVGALLSGGIDSSLLVSLMARSAPDSVKTFNVSFGDSPHDESKSARAIAEHLGTDHAELHVGPSEAVDAIPDITSIFDEPFANPSSIPTLLISRLCRKEVSVVLTGDGADELFAGYNRYHSGSSVARKMAHLPATVRRGLAGASEPLTRLFLRGTSGRVLESLHRLPASKARKLSRMLGANTAAAMYESLLRTSPDPARFFSEHITLDRRRFSESLLPIDTGLESLLKLDQATYLQGDLLFKLDRTSMSTGLEARVPFLDHRIVELARRMPSHLKYRDGQSKWILRQILRKFVPNELFDRPKVGFTVPIDDWLRSDLKTWAGDLLFASETGRDNLFDKTSVKLLWNGFRRQDPFADPLELWALVQLQAWRHAHGDLR